MKQKKTVLVQVLKSLLGFLMAMFFLSVLVFLISRLAPGDPLQAFYGDAMETMTMEEQEKARIRLGLDGSLFTQYIRWIQNAAYGEFGISLKYKMPALDVVKPLIGNTLLLGGTAYLLVFALAILLAVFCARFEDTWIDRVICKVGTAVYYIPPFWLGVVLVLIFSVNLKLLPSSGAYDIGKESDIGNRMIHLILPLIVMIVSHLWYYAYMIRNKLLDEIRKDYVLLARMKGLGKDKILWKHCLRNTAPAIINIMAVSIPHVLSGTYVAEAVFHYPGLGELSVESAKYHDYNLLMLLVLITGVLVIVSSMLARFVNEMIDPRMKSREVADWN